MLLHLASAVMWPNNCWYFRIQ